MVLTAILLEGNGHYRVIHIQGSPDEGGRKKIWELFSIAILSFPAF